MWNGLNMGIVLLSNVWGISNIDYKDIYLGNSIQYFLHAELPGNDNLSVHLRDQDEGKIFFVFPI